MDEGRGARTLKAILVADAVGYSMLMTKDEEGTLRAFKNDLSLKIAPKVAAYRGRIVKKTGDGVLAVFDSVLDAVECAEDIQRKAGVANGHEPEPQAGLTYRIGINLGDIFIEEDDVYGNDVNIASRLESLAEPGGIVLSGAAYWSVKPKVDRHFEEMGFLNLKNIAEPIQVFRSTACGAPVPKAVPAAAPARSRLWSEARGDRPVLIVLPFENLSGDPAQEYFCDGLTNDLMTDLSRFANFVVLAANTAFSYKGQRVSAAHLREELGVDYMAEGTVQRMGSRIRVNAQLIDTEHGHHLWAERLHADMDDLFELQDEVVRKVVSSLASKLGAIEVDRAARREPSDVSAYQALLKGLYSFNQFLGATETEAVLHEAIGWFERSLERDPGYGRALGWLAYAHVQAWSHGWDGDQALERAEAMAKKAVELDSSDHDTHWALASVYSNAGRFDQALRAYEAALQLNKNDADLHAEMAEMLSYAGRHHDAIAQVRYAMRLNPHHREWYRWVLGWAYYFIGAHGEALAELDQIRSPADEVLLIRAASHAQLARASPESGGHGEAARRLVAEFLARRPDWSVARQMNVTRLMKAEDLAAWAEGLTAAGLPERTGGGGP